MPNKASDLFTKSFTANYEEIAAADPVYGQMRNQIDMLIAAAFMQREDLYGRASWRGEHCQSRKNQHFRITQNRSVTTVFRVYFKQPF